LFRQVLETAWIKLNKKQKMKYDEEKK